MIRVRKIITFLMFLGIFTAIAYTAAGDWLAEQALISKTGVSSRRFFSVAQGMDGNSYALSYGDEYRVLCLSSDGKREYERVLKRGLPEHFSIEDLHVSAEGFILLSLYEHADDGFIYGLYISEDSGKSFNALPLGTHGYSSENKSGVALSSISEYNGQLLFFLRIGERWLRFSFNTADRELVNEGEFILPGEIITGIVARDRTIYAARPNGTLLRITGLGAAVREEPNTDRLYTRFMQTDEGFAYIDGMSGNLMAADRNSGYERPILHSGELPCASADVSALYLDRSGNILLIEDYKRLYTRLYKPSHDGSSDESGTVTPAWEHADETLYGSKSMSLMNLTVIGLVVFLLSYSFYYLFSEVRKLYIPMVLRGFLTMGLLVFITLTVALELFIRPQYMDNARAQALNFLHGYASRYSPENSPEPADYAVKLGLRRINAYSLDQNRRVIYSTDPLYGIGYMAEAPAGLGAFIRAAESDSEIAVLETAGEILYTAYVKFYDGSLLIVTSDASALESDISAAYRRFTIVIRNLSIVLLLLASLSLEMAARRVRRITTGVDKLAQARYDTEISLGSGDELQALAESFNGLAQSLGKRVLGEELRNLSYLQFIPQQMVSLMGVSSIEEVNKSTSASRDLAMMIVWFGVPETLHRNDPQTLFDNINAVIGRTSSVVSKNGGTIYDFTYDGYTAVFPGGSGAAVSAAVEIRQGIMSLNRERESQKNGSINLRIAIDKGNVMMGVVGDDNRMSPTAVSSCLNTARMLINLSQSLDANILCTMVVADDIDGYFVRYIGKPLDDGEITRVYEIADGDEYDMRLGKEKTRRQFSEGVYLLYGGDFTAAKRLFMDMLKISNLDGVARYYLYLADKLETEGAGEIYLN